MLKKIIDVIYIAEEERIDNRLIRVAAIQEGETGPVDRSDRPVD